MGDESEVRTAAHERSRQLTIFERMALSLGACLNATDSGKALQDFYLRGVGYPWMRLISGRRMLIDGIDDLQALAPARGVLLIANHRSFFDFYAISVAMFGGPLPWLNRLHFPVRGAFFYTHPAGLLVNLAAGMGVMYPPFFRQRGKLAVNRDAMTYLMRRLDVAGNLVGIHPEGRRSKQPDPYRLEPLQPGAAELALKARPLIVPVFINGASDSVSTELRKRYQPDAQMLHPVIVSFGKAITPDDLPASEPSARSYRLVTDFFEERLVAQGQQEKALRAACAAGMLQSDDRRWLVNRGGGRFYAHRR